MSEKPNEQTFRVRARFIFDGHFDVTAETRDQALEYVDKHCGLVLGGNIHSSLPTGSVDWNFPVHPVKSLSSVKLLP